MKLYQKWLKENTEYLNKQGTHYLLCRTGKLNDEDLLVFELGERTCFVLVDSKNKTKFSFGDIEWKGFPSLGVFGWGHCSNHIFIEIVEEIISQDISDLKKEGKIVYGNKMTIKKIKDEYFNKEKNLFTYNDSANFNFQLDDF